MNIRLIVFSVLLNLTASITYSQIGIGTSSPHSSSIVDVTATNKALLLPRLTSEQRAGISNPANGLVIFCTNCGTNGEMQVYSSTAWKNVLGNTISASLPVLSTTAISNISYTSVTAGGDITYSDATVTARGVCLSTSQNPTTSNTSFSIGTGTGVFSSSSITGLTINTAYYLRAYATNSAGTSYGTQVTFSTLAATPATFGTTTYASVTGNAATVSSTISSENGASVSARGICWSTSSNPTISSNTQASGTGSGSYSITLSTLEALTTYYVRSYATNSAGTSYSNEVSFTTGVRTLPTLTTTAISNINTTWASSGGNISSLGSSAVTAKGVCWSTSPNPTLANSTKVQSGNVTGSFSTNIDPLTSNNTYYVRAYATNGSGTAYGNEISFTTLLATGESYAGGIIAYILASGDNGYDANVQHGFIVSNVYLGASTWGCDGNISGLSTALGTGAANTAAIIASNCATANTPAKLCDNYSVIENGITYNDWYLPSSGEAGKIWLGYRAFSTLTTSMMAYTYFATSSQDATNPSTWYYTWITHPNVSGLSSTQKNQTNANVGVRAVRSF